MNSKTLVFGFLCVAATSAQADECDISNPNTVYCLTIHYGANFWSGLGADDDFFNPDNWNFGIVRDINDNPIIGVPRQDFANYFGPVGTTINGEFTGFELPTGIARLDEDFASTSFRMAAWDGTSTVVVENGTLSSGNGQVGVDPGEVPDGATPYIASGAIQPATIILDGGTLAGTWDFIPFTTVNQPGSVASRLVVSENTDLSSATIYGGIGSLEVGSGVDFRVSEGFSLFGEVLNSGTLEIVSTNNSVADSLVIADTVTLKGGGTIKLGSNDSIEEDGVGDPDLLINKDQTIRGSGAIRVAVQNDDTIIAEGSSLNLAGPLINNGLVRAESGFLQFSDLKSNTGTIEIGSLGLAFFDGDSAVDTGSVVIEDGGQITRNSNLRNAELTGDGIYRFQEGVTLSETLTQAGTLEIVSTNNSVADSLVIADTVTLKGGGTIKLGSNDSIEEDGVGDPDLLINKDQTIRGSGAIRVAVQNDDTIIAEGSSLNLAGPLINNGLVRAESGFLQFSDLKSNTGTIEIGSLGLAFFDGDSAVDTGSVVIEDGGQITRNSNLRNAELTGDGIYRFQEGVTLSETLTQAGTLEIVSTNNSVADSLVIADTVTLKGGGTIKLGSNDSIEEDGVGDPDLLINKDQTIRGSGAIRVAVQNDDTIIAEGSSLNLAGPLINNGLVRAESGFLQFSDLKSNTGTIEIGSLGLAFFDGDSAVDTGSVVIEDGGQITRNSNLRNAELTGDGIYRFQEGVTLSETLTQAGTLEIVSTNNSVADSLVIADTVTLKGGGTIKLGSNDSIEEDGVGDPDLLINKDQTIRGSGAIRVAVQNDDTIIAEGGYLSVSNDIRGGGEIEVRDGAGLIFNGSTIQANSILVADTGYFQAPNARIEAINFIGDYIQESGVYAPGASPAVSLHDGDLTLNGGLFELEFSDSAFGMFDHLTVSGDFTLGGASLSVVSLDGFDFTPNSYFDVVNVEGSLTGIFAGLGEGSLIDGFGVDLFITYTAGDGNDIALYTAGGTPTAPVPLPASVPALLTALGSLGLLKLRRYNRNRLR